MRVHGGVAPPWAADYSAPGNPLGPPPWLGEVLEECIGRRVYLRYPDPGYRGLREAIASWHGVDAGEVVVLGGSAEGLAELPHLLRVAGVAALEPTFGDHGVHAAVLPGLVRLVAWRPVGMRYALDEAVAESALRGGWLVFTSNPNNPTGGVAPPSLLEDLGRLAAARRALLLVDEAFADLSPGYKPLQAAEGLALLRSLTKTFSTPGLRAGYLYAERRVAARIEASRQAWPVSSIAACVYEALLSEERGKWWASRARLLVSQEAPRLASEMRRLGLEAYEPRAPLILAKHPATPNPLFAELLAARGVYARDASSYHGLGPLYTRFAVRTPGENNALLKALRGVVERRAA